MRMVKSHEKNIYIKITFLWWCSKMSPKSEFLKDGYCVLHGKNDGVWRGIFQKYLKQNIITAVLRKANADSVVICGLIKKLTMQMKTYPRGKIDSNFLAHEFQ